jgi:hypothetical protein
MKHKYLTTLCFFIYASAAIPVFLFSTEVPCYELHNKMQALFLEIIPTRYNSGDTHAKLHVIEPPTRLIKGSVSIKKILNYETYYHFSYDNHHNNKRLLVDSASFIENVDNTLYKNKNLCFIAFCNTQHEIICTLSKLQMDIWFQNNRFRQTVCTVFPEITDNVMDLYAMSKINSQEFVVRFKEITAIQYTKPTKLGWIQETDWNPLVQEETQKIQTILNECKPIIMKESLRKTRRFLAACILCVLATGISALYYYFH